MLPVVLALVAAAFFAASSVQQHHAAATAPADSGTGVRLVLTLLRTRRWLRGLGFGLTGAALQALALSEGALLVVQPLLVTGLLLALPLSVVVERRRPSRAEWRWAIGVVVGLSLFLTAGDPSGGQPRAVPGTLRVALLVVAAAVLLTTALSAARGGRYRALLLGLGGGASMGAAGALLKELTGRVADGGGTAVLSWPLLALALAGATGVVLNQSSYRVGVLTASQPAITMLEPMTAAAIGAVAFGERLAMTPTALAVQVAGVALMVISVIQLSRITAGQPADRTTVDEIRPTPDRPTVGRPPEDELC